jgi:hypothetical protein
MNYNLMESWVNYTYLATKGTVGEGIKKASFTDMASIGDSFARPRLRSFI